LKRIAHLLAVSFEIFVFLDEPTDVFIMEAAKKLSGKCPLPGNESGVRDRFGGDS